MASTSPPPLGSHRARRGWTVRGKSQRNMIGFATAANHTRSVRLVPDLLGEHEDGTIVVNDLAVLADVAFRSKPVRVCTMAARISALCIFNLFGILMVMWAPFAILSYTHAAQHYFNATALTNATSNRSLSGNDANPGRTMIPWSVEWEDTCLVFHGIFCVGASYLILDTVAGFCHYGMLCRLWSERWASILALLLLSVVYSSTATTILPDSMHLLWLVTRLLFILFVTFYDTVSVTFSLRFHKEHMDALCGDPKRGCRGQTCQVLMVYCIMFQLVAVDLFRHFILISMAETHNIIKLEIRNPFDGEQIGYTNRQLAESSYFTSMVFILQGLSNIIRNRFFRGTISLRANFIILRNEAVDGEKSSKSSKQNVFGGSLISAAMKDLGKSEEGSTARA